MKHPKEERTVLLIKPDGVRRGLIGEIISRIEQRGLKIIALQMIHANKEQMDNHYPKDSAWIERLGRKSLDTYKKYNMDPLEKIGTKDPAKIGRKIRSWIIDFMISGPMIKMVVSGIHAIDMVRKLAGNTLPNLAEMGTIRGDYSVDSPAAANADCRGVRNIVHASETPEEAKNELKEWFTASEIHDYDRSDDDVMF